MAVSLQALAVPDVLDRIRAVHLFVAAALLLDYGLRGDQESVVCGAVECLSTLCTTPGIAAHLAKCVRLGGALELHCGEPAPLQASLQVTLTVVTDLRALVFLVDEFFRTTFRWCYHGFRFHAHVTAPQEDPQEDLLPVAAFTETVKTLDHHSTVLSLAHSETRLLLGTRDGAISVWDPVSSRSERRLLGDGGPVFSLAAHGDALLSGSSKDIQVWDSTRMECVTTLRGHSDSVHALLLARGYLLSGSADATIVVLDVKLSSTVGTLAGHT